MQLYISFTSSWSLRGLVLAVGCFALMQGCEADVAECTVDGVVYVAGESFAAVDGCNTCSCEADGSLACTKMACAPASCESFGTTYEIGQSWIGADGCTECICQDDGAVTCSSEPCEPEGCDHRGGIFSHAESFPAGDGCNSCTCNDGEVSCTKQACVADCAADADCDKGYACVDAACVYTPCLGLACGELCEPCDINNPDMPCPETAVDSFCNEEGVCEDSVPACAAAQDPCESMLCECGCVEGVCQPCSPDVCLDDSECPESYACESGACVYNGCLNLKCGESCSPCDPEGVDCQPDEDGAACDASGACVPASNELGCEGSACDAMSCECGCADEGCLACPDPDDLCTPGSSFDAPDGCNTCECPESGVKADAESCTEAVCGCMYEGTYYAEGESFPAADDCNTCSCFGGEVICTLMACIDEPCLSDADCPGPGESCVEGACVPYEPVGELCTPGESFTAADGCNTCGCPESGLVIEAMCTKMLCAPCEVDGESIPAGTSFAAGDLCNLCTCVDGEVLCTELPCESPCWDDSECSDGEVCDSGTCVADDAEFCEPGESFASSDGCNTCFCQESGLVADASCTEMDCEPVTCTDGSQCGADQFCDFTADDCGVWGALGECTSKPEVCAAGGVGACGCDGKSALNACELQSQGVDVNRYGGCGLSGSGSDYACGDTSCSVETQICTISMNDIMGPDQPEYFASCGQLPAGCNQGDCACLELDPWTACYDLGGVTLVLYPGG